MYRFLIKLKHFMFNFELTSIGAANFNFFDLFYNLINSALYRFRRRIYVRFTDKISTMTFCSNSLFHFYEKYIVNTFARIVIHIALIFQSYRKQMPCSHYFYTCAVVPIPNSNYFTFVFPCK